MFTLFYHYCTNLMHTHTVCIEKSKLQNCNIMKWIMCDKCLLSEKLHPTCKPIRHIDCQSDIPVLDLESYLILATSVKIQKYETCIFVFIL